MFVARADGVQQCRESAAMLEDTLSPSSPCHERMRAQVDCPEPTLVEPSSQMQITVSVANPSGVVVIPVS